MDLNELLRTAAKESEERKQAELQGLQQLQARFVLEDEWIALDASLKDNASTPDLNPFLAALAAYPHAKQRLSDLQDAAQADYEQRRDTRAGLTASAAAAILANDAPSFLRIAALRTSDSWGAVRAISDTIWGRDPEQPEPLKVQAWQEAGSDPQPVVVQTRIAKQHSAPDYQQQVISTLLRHHHPADDWRSLGCWDPLKQKEILTTFRLADSQKGRISEVIKELFGSQLEYAQRCRRQSPELLRILRAAAGETTEATGTADRIDGIAGSNQELQELLLDLKSS